MNDLSPMDVLHSSMASLSLTEADAVVETHLERASKEERSYAAFLQDLLTCEIEARKERQLRTRLRFARLPYEKTLEMSKSVVKSPKQRSNFPHS